jgi:threonine aldolase
MPESTAYPVIDLRSDTVTRPTPAMRRAMAEADVGDDVAGDDPTVNRLQEVAAERLGKEAGLFVPSGSMGNLIAGLTHCVAGDAIVLDALCHSRIYEVGGITALGGIVMDPVPSRADGQPDPEGYERAIQPENLHCPKTRLMMFENTSNRGGGACVTPETSQKMREIADRHGLRVHLDGARVFNSAVAQGVDVSVLAAPADSVMFCFSKGLCAPIGSMLVGTREFIARALKKRKMLGGGMRQVGVVAAAALVALETMVDRLAEDHAKAAELAAGIRKLGGPTIPHAVQTNMVYISTEAVGVPAKQLATALHERGVWAFDTGPWSIRFVTHHDVPADAIPEAVRRIEQCLSEARV